MTDKSPKISCEDVRIQLGGVFSGSSNDYWFWENNIPSGSLWQTISGSDAYLRFLCGDTIWDNTDANTAQAIKYCEINYVCFKTLVTLAGGVIVQGFDWSLGPVRVSTPAMLQTYTNLINGFGAEAEKFIRTLLPIHYLYDAEMPSIGKTSSSAM